MKNALIRQSLKEALDQWLRGSNAELGKVIKAPSVMFQELLDAVNFNAEAREMIYQARIPWERLSEKIHLVFQQRGGILASLAQVQTPRAQDVALWNQQKPVLMEIVRMVIQDDHRRWPNIFSSNLLEYLDS